MSKRIENSSIFAQSTGMNMTMINWEAWQKNNIKLTAEGWQLVTEFMSDGRVLEYAVKDGIKIENEPEAFIKHDT